MSNNNHKPNRPVRSVPPKAEPQTHVTQPSKLPPPPKKD